MDKKKLRSICKWLYGNNNYQDEELRISCLESLKMITLNIDYEGKESTLSFEWTGLFIENIFNHLAEFFDVESTPYPNEIDDFSKLFLKVLREE